VANDAALIYRATFHHSGEYIETRVAFDERWGGAAVESLQKKVNWSRKLPLVDREWVHVDYPFENAGTQVAEGDACLVRGIDGLWMSSGLLGAAWRGELSAGLSDIPFDYGLEPRLTNRAILNVHAKI
jgi:hypothetical protein